MKGVFFRVQCFLSTLGALHAVIGTCSYTADCRLHFVFLEYDDYLPSLNIPSVPVKTTTEPFSYGSFDLKGIFYSDLVDPFEEEVDFVLSSKHKFLVPRSFFTSSEVPVADWIEASF